MLILLGIAAGFFGIWWPIQEARERVAEITVSTWSVVATVALPFIGLMFIVLGDKSESVDSDRRTSEDHG